MEGGLYDRAITLADCQAACVQRFPLCVAINVNRRANNLVDCFLLPQLRPLRPSAANMDNYQAIIASQCQVTSAYHNSYS